MDIPMGRKICYTVAIEYKEAAMERLDKIIANRGAASRREVKDLVRQGRVLVNGVPASAPDMKVAAETAVITVDGVTLSAERYLYLLLHKPAGVLTATEDKRQPTVLNLIPETYRRRDLAPVGRLDKDTTGLLLLTDDGTFAHKVISPKSHVSKLYEAVVDGTPCEADFAAFREGIVLRDGTQCLPAELIDLGGGRVQVEVFEGKYHQVKRMLGSRQMSVLQLKRLRIGGLWLDGSLAEGEYRRLTPEEIEKIRPDILSK